MQNAIIQFIFGTIFGTAFGSVITGLISAHFDKKKNKYTSKHKFKEDRYKAIVLLMYSLANYENEQVKLQKHRPDLTTREELIDELTAEWTNMSLYANDTVLMKTKGFLENPDQEHLNVALIAMRHNLYDIHTQLKPEDLTLNIH
jgi:hypothetical protein